MGVEMAELALSWRRLQHRDRLLTNIISFFLLMGLFAFTLNGGYIDQMGHLGGLICGEKLAALAHLRCTADNHRLSHSAKARSMLISFIAPPRTRKQQHDQHFSTVVSVFYASGLSLGFLYNKDMQDKPRWWSFAMWCSVFLLVALPASCVPVIFAVNRGCTL